MVRPASDLESEKPSLVCWMSKPSCCGMLCRIGCTCERATKYEIVTAATSKHTPTTIHLRTWANDWNISLDITPRSLLLGLHHLDPRGEMLLRHADDEAIARYVVQRLATLGPTRHKEADREAEQGEKLHEMPDRGLTERCSLTVRCDNLQPQQ